MDVVKCLLGAKLIVFALLISSCSQTKTTTSVMASSTECVGEAYADRFIVQWEDGSFSVEHGNSQAEFRNGFVKDNLSLIKHVDIDQKIYLPPQDVLRPQNESVASNSAPVSGLNWGPEMIQASSLWSQSINGDGIVVAVIDGMVDVNHQQLHSNILVNEGEVPDNQKDDDGNGFVDDVYGVQINDEKNDPKLNRHGSHVAGIIAADSTMGPVQGVAPRAKILPAQFIGNDEGGSLGDAITAMNYAATRGAKIMNMSWGGAPCIPNLQAAMKKLSDQGILLITAAGNEGKNMDTSPNYPSAFGLPNQINVAASTVQDVMIYFSNFGFRTVQVAAPGVEIYSTVPGNQIESMSGTSMAAPMTAGAAALIWSAFPNATAQQVKQALLRGVDVTSGHEFQVSTHGRINVNKSYLALKNILGL